MVYNSGIRKAGSEVQQLSLAIAAFHGKYNCLPGDCANATDFFGTGTPCGSSTAPANGTCNGNGDGFIEAWWRSSHWVNYIEAAYGLQQLSLAQLVPERYVGAGNTVGVLLGGASQNLVSARLVPVSSFNPAIGYYPFTMAYTTYTPSNVPSAYIFQNVIQVGALATSSSLNDFLSGSGFTAPQAFILDQKFDDGNASSGRIQAANSGHASAINSNITCLSGSAYSTSTSTGCLLYYKFDVP